MYIYIMTLSYHIKTLFTYKHPTSLKTHQNSSCIIYRLAHASDSRRYRSSTLGCAITCRTSASASQRGGHPVFRDGLTAGPESTGTPLPPCPSWSGLRALPAGVGTDSVRGQPSSTRTCGGDNVKMTLSCMYPPPFGWLARLPGFFNNTLIHIHEECMRTFG